MIKGMRFHKETGFRESAIGKIPKEWTAAELGDESVAEIILGQSPPSSTYNQTRDGLPFLQGKMDFSDIYPSTTTFCSAPLKTAEPDDILLSVRAPVGAVNIAQTRYCIGRGLSAIRARKEKLDHLFLYYYLKYARRKFESVSVGSTFKAIRRDEIARFSIPLPFVQEQIGIVEILSTVDRAIRKNDDVIAKTERFKKGLIQQLLTRGIGHTEYKDTPIGKTPKTWQVVRIGDIAETSSGGTPSRSKKEYFDGEIPWVKSGELKDNTLYATEETISKEGLQNSAAKIFPKGTLLIALYGATVGKTAILGIDATTNQAVCAILTKGDTINPEFLKYYIISRREQLIAVSAGGAQPNISQEIIRYTNVPLPQPQEQRRIAEILLTLDKKLEVERAEMAKLENIKHGLMDLLLTGKVRIKVD